MHFSEQIQVPVSTAEAWDFIWQVQRLARCLPGCVGVAEVETGRRYKAQFADQIGPYKLQFELDVDVLETKPMELVRVQANGKDRRLGVSQRATLLVKLRESSPSASALDVEADIEVIGKVATLGQFVIKRKAQDIVRQFARNIESELRPQVAGGAHA